MCILFLHYHPSSTSVSFSDAAGGGQCTCPYALVAASNRDEFFGRATVPLDWWGENKVILGGQDIEREDLSERGTWLGVSRKAKFSALTNYRTPPHLIKPDAKSRGMIVSNFLSGDTPPLQYCQSLLAEGQDYNGFSSIAADLSGDNVEMVYCSNRAEGGARVLSAGNYGLSNALLDTPWRKVQQGKAELEQVMRSVGQDSADQPHLIESLIKLLTNDTCLYPDPNVADTSFSEEVMKYVSAVFVKPVTVYGQQYGTRTSSVVLWERSGKVTFTERTLNWPPSPGDPDWITHQSSFHIPKHL